MKLLLFSLITILFFVNCSSTPTYLDLRITTTQNSNLDDENISSPLMLRFYELKTAEKFSKLNFWALIDKGSEKLRNDILSESKHIILPNEQQFYRILFDSKAKFIGIIAKFQNIKNNAIWKFVQNLELNSLNEINLKIDQNQMKVID